MLVERLVYLFTSVLLTWFVQHLALVVLARRRDNFYPHPPSLAFDTSVSPALARNKHLPRSSKQEIRKKGFGAAHYLQCFALHPLRLTPWEHATHHMLNPAFCIQAARVNGC